MKKGKSGRRMNAREVETTSLDMEEFGGNFIVRISFGIQLLDCFRYQKYLAIVGLTRSSFQ